jgi:hypothetical protein
MAEDLAAHAAANLSKCVTRLTQAQQTLAAAHDELDRRVDDPATVPVDQRRTQLGAAQYLEQAVLDEAAARADEARIRLDLAAIPTPDASHPLVVALRSNLMTQADARVRLRDAMERAARAQAAVANAAAAVDAAGAAVRDATTRADRATDRQQKLTQLTTSLGEPPLKTLVADATALSASATLTDARDRVAELLPPKLLDRSSVRGAEAGEPLAGAAVVATSALAEANGLLGTDADAALSIARARLDLAEQQLRNYAGSAAARLSRAETLLTPLAKLPDLSPAEAASIDEKSAERKDAVRALGFEKDLAAARRTWDDKDRAVTNARLAALAEDPDRDPETAQAVIDAIAARDDKTIVDPLNNARAKYDDAAQNALNAWEVEVPAWLWQAALDLHEATAELTALADNAARTALVTELNDAIDVYVAAADAAAVSRRATDSLGQQLRRLTTEVDVLSATTDQRLASYVRGDGRGGRHVLEI